MTSPDWLAEQFAANRAHLHRVAFRMLSSRTEADDAVQEAWLRLSKSGADDVANLTGWLTTVVARVCLDMLRSRTARREEPLDGAGLESATADGSADPEREALLADSIGLALLAVLETLTPAERVAFVLHDLFDVPFDQVAQIVGRSEVASRQLASRARRRVQGAEPAGAADASRREQVVSAFLAASRGGDFAALLAVLDPAVELRADEATVLMGAQGHVIGSDAVAATFAGRAKGAQLALVDGVPGAVWMQDGKPRVVFTFTIDAERITGIAMRSDSEHVAGLDLVLLG